MEESLPSCGGVNENGPIGLYFNIWVPVGRVIWEGLGDVPLLEEVSP